MLSRISSTLLRTGEGSCGSHIIRGKAHLVGYVLSFDFPCRPFFKKNFIHVTFAIESEKEWEKMRSSLLGSIYLHAAKWGGFCTGSSWTQWEIAYTSQNQRQYRGLGLHIPIKRAHQDVTCELNCHLIIRIIGSSQEKIFQISLLSTKWLKHSNIYPQSFYFFKISTFLMWERLSE